MARPIPYASPPYDPAAELNARLHEAPAEHAQAMLSLYEVIQGMHDRGVLDLLRGALGSGDKVVDTLVELSDSHEAVRGLRNLLALAKALADFDPDVLQGLTRALPEALETVKTHDPEPPGFMGLLRNFRSKNLRRGVVFVATLLEALGRNLPCKRRA